MVTKKVNFLEPSFSEKEVQTVFNGSISDKGFHLSKVITRADSFLPLVHGTIESSLKGSILFIEYSLFPGSRFFLAFWSIISLLLAVFFSALYGDHAVGALCLTAGMGNWLFSWSNFNRKVRDTKQTLHRLLDLQTKDHR
ncbi:MAG: hypothetical protein JJU34_20270 [Lunatimonas sp.]|uniref:hypothetical protein n=1 Tax=Lunatimonas sp. TaxID=2060141 RepID=UPI00263AB09C|nr:hypothetical protein [Lunatimonas sp.]MCC5939627.1 hypothetical protein [Lunatimonas sp.]